MINSSETSLSWNNFNLILLFEKLGGKFSCNFYKNTCKLKTQDMIITTWIKETVGSGFLYQYYGVGTLISKRYKRLKKNVSNKIKNAR